MARSERLLQLMQMLRLGTPPMRAQTLANELGISVRSLYRDIDSLRVAGAIIDGEAGFGYTLVEDPALPPMMFGHDEMEAIVLGLREVVEVGDPVLANAGKQALAKLKACLPPRMQMQFEHSVLHAKRFHHRAKISIDVAELRRAAREELAVDISYTDGEKRTSERRIFPLAIVFMDNCLVLSSWCKMRLGYRTFRIDRITRMVVTKENFRPKRVPMMREYFGQMKREIEAMTRPD